MKLPKLNDSKGSSRASSNYPTQKKEECISSKSKSLQLNVCKPISWTSLLLKSTRSSLTLTLLSVKKFKSIDELTLIDHLEIWWDRYRRSLCWTYSKKLVHRSTSSELECHHLTIGHQLPNLIITTKPS